jgi:UDP-hydrolysing UDP-N-acetyl-D-glucosamine 2-epimerase
VNISVVSGSRADYGLLEWPLKCLREDPFFSVAEVNIWNHTAASALQAMTEHLQANRPDYILILGDRYEILSAAIAAHLQRIPIAHIGGGDVSQGSYDDAMRDCISRLATLHFATSDHSVDRLHRMGFSGVHLVGNPAIDYIRHSGWQKPRTTQERYVVVAYYPETIDDTVDLEAVKAEINGRNAIWITPNLDRGVERIPEGLSFSHADFLNLLVYAEEFIGNSSAIFYEAPELGVRTTLLGKRQRGRVIPFGDGKASERIIKILKEHAPNTAAAA